MKKIKNELINTYKNINMISKSSIKLGAVLSVSFIISAIIIYTKFSGDITQWRMVERSRELAECGIGCCLSALISAFIIEIIYNNSSK